ncbi:conserved exported protein of unknown function [Sterolibacterium denitrificans]|uniref:Lipoprotein n=2 Tax=Sterolibacterium denitrificans TaxID=157592 RepID=A0A7Z7HSH1_9PROT|nr:conserved exported protein of unknown function [Sterolibacterium denitrificans]
MKKNAMMMFALIAALVLAGCKEEKPQEPVQTVEWFKAHQAEREARLAKCNANPGELAATPNCVNASRAESSSVWSKRGGIKAPAALTFEKNDGK